MDTRRYSLLFGFLSGMSVAGALVETLAIHGGALMTAGILGLLILVVAFQPSRPSPE